MNLPNGTKMKPDLVFSGDLVIWLNPNLNLLSNLPKTY